MEVVSVVVVVVVVVSGVVVVVVEVVSGVVVVVEVVSVVVVMLAGTVCLKMPFKLFLKECIVRECSTGTAEVGGR